MAARLLSSSIDLKNKRFSYTNLAILSNIRNRPRMLECQLRSLWVGAN